MENNQLDQRLTAIESRLSLLEEKIGHSIPSPLGWHEPPSVSAGTDELPFKERSASKPGNWLGIIAVICFIFAAGFIIKLSIETGWLTPERQIVIAMLFGGALIVAGLALLHTYRGYASLLPATGIIILYLSAFASHRLYNLLPFSTALALTILISILCLWLYLKIKHDVYAITAAIGAYLSPMILDFNSIAIFSLYYYVCCSFTFASLSVWLRSRTMTVVAAYLAILVTAIIGFNLSQDILIAEMLVLHFLIFALGTYLYTLYNHQQLSEGEAWSFFPVLMLFYAMEYYFISKNYPDLASWLSLAFAALLIILYLSAQRWFSKEQIHSQPVILAFAAIVFFHSFYLELLPDNYKPWLFVVIMAAYAVLPKLSSFENRKAYYFPMLVLLVIAVIEYMNIMGHLLKSAEVTSAWFGVAAAAFAAIWLRLIMPGDDKQGKNYGSLLLAAAHGLAIAGLYRLTEPHGSLPVSISWLCYAVLVMGFAYQRKDQVMAKSALLVLALAAGKALLYDASSTPTVVRIVCLLLTGIVLYGAGFLMKKIAEWKR